MPISSITSTTAGTAATSATTGLAATSDTFLKLLVTNLQHQDPTKPQDSNEYVQQISQMTMVEQMTKLATTQEKAAKDQQVTNVLGLLGRSVTYTTGTDTPPLTGTVTKVDVSGVSPTFAVGGSTGLDPNTIISVS